MVRSGYLGSPLQRRRHKNRGHAGVTPHGLCWHCPAPRVIPSPENQCTDAASVPVQVAGCGSARRSRPRLIHCKKKAAWKIGLTRVRTLNPAPSIPVQRLTRASPASEIDEKADGSIIPEDDPSMVVMSPLLEIRIVRGISPCQAGSTSYRSRSAKPSLNIQFSADDSPAPFSIDKAAVSEFGTNCAGRS
jgi:hypothetical protein